MLPLYLFVICEHGISGMCQEYGIKVLCYLYDNVNNIVGGVIASAVFAIIIFIAKWFKFYFKAKKLKNIFGYYHLNEDYSLVSGKICADPQTLQQKGLRSYVFAKPNNTQVKFTQNAVMPSSEAIAINYVKSTMEKGLAINCKMVFDEDLQSPNSYCSFGGYNNNYSVAVLKSSRNKFWDILFDANTHLPYIQGLEKNVVYSMDATNDYGVIIKIKEPNTNSVQICVAGLGEAGTVGCAHFLATKWKELEEKFGDKEFGCVIKVVINQPTSNSMVNDSVAK